jgi:hypothetical protein
MAQITITTTSEQDAAIQYATAVYNSQAPEAERETPLQFFMRHVRHKLSFWVQQWQDATKLSRGELYQRATAEDQATIDAILQKYQ